MRMKLFAAVLASSLVAGSALAADLPSRAEPPVYVPPPPVFTWTGFYVGLNAGYLATFDSGNPYCVNPAGAVNGAGCSFYADTPLHSRPAGFIGGSQIGYNLEVNRFIAGIEADFQGTTASGSSTLTLINPVDLGQHQDQVSSKIDYLGTVRGRLGFAVIDQLMLYGTGGLAYGGGSVSSTFSAPSLAAPNVLYPSSLSYFRAGWTLGAGGEYAFSPNWTVKLEGLYYDLGTVKTAGTEVIGVANGYTEGKTFDLTGVIVRVGVNYKFGAPPPPPPAPVVAKY